MYTVFNQIKKNILTVILCWKTCLHGWDTICLNKMWKYEMPHSQLLKFAKSILAVPLYIMCAAMFASLSKTLLKSQLLLFTQQYKWAPGWTVLAVWLENHECLSVARLRWLRNGRQGLITRASTRKSGEHAFPMH